MPMLSALGSRFSHILHQFVFSLPDPSNSTLATKPHEDSTSLLDMFDEPGESRALAGGIGPLSFIGSGYGIMLVLMAILLNRIHHIVRRPRIPPPPRRGGWRHRVSKALTHPSTPRYLRLPGVIALTRACILFTILLLQVAKVWPERGWFERKGHWVGDMEMEKVCWQVFLSVCTGLACGGIANGLDRTRRREPGAAFNLFGYSFLLHLYSSPLTHHHQGRSRPRPDVHALFQLWLGLIELSWLQTIELFPTIRHNLLIPTGVCGSLGLAHFVYALATAPLKFPSFTFLTHLMALLLSIVILFSMALKGITYLFTYGYIPSLVGLLPHEGVVPNVEDDFGVTLLKIGTACIEATQYSGLRNELVRIERPWVEISASGSDIHKSAYPGFGAEITNIEVAESTEGSESPYWKQLVAFWRACGLSLTAFTWGMVMATPVGRKVVGMAKATWLKRWWYGPRQWRVWRREAWREPPMAVTRRQAQAIRVQTVASETATSTAVELNPEAIPYGRYLMGQAEIEDDDDDWADDSSDSSGDESDESEEEQGLFKDLVRYEQDEGDIQPVLLAHMTSQTNTPLTRRRYAALLSNRSTPSGMQDLVQERRSAAASHLRDDDDEERRRACVVCMTQTRDTILWPCRCLALCNDCRESLASRLPASDHMCPCCRRKVDGYSRVYIP